MLTTSAARSSDPTVQGVSPLTWASIRECHLKRHIRNDLRRLRCDGMSGNLSNESLRRKAGKALIALSFPAALALPARRYLLPFTCGEAVTFGTAALFFSAPLFTVGGWLLLISRKPRGVGYWAIGIALGLPFWWFAALSTGCTSG